MPRTLVQHLVGRRVSPVLALGLAVWTAAANAETTVPFRLVRDRIVIDASLNGAGPYPLMVDMGQPRSVIAGDVAEALRLPQASSVLVEAPGSGDAVLDIVHIEAVEVGETRLGPMTCAVMDLSAMAVVLGAPVAGILGGRDLAASITLDFGASALVLRGPSPFEKDDPGVLGLNRLDAGGLTTGALINGRLHLPFELDMTFPGVVALPEDLARNNGLIGPATRRLEAVGALPTAPAFDGIQFRLDAVKLGAAVVRRSVCSLLPAGEPARLGVGFMKQCRLTIDYAQSLAKVEAPKNAVTDPPIVGCGLAPDRCVDGFWSVWVARHSPADRAGIAPASTLLYAGGHPVAGASAEQVLGWLSAPEGENIHVVVSHEGRETEVTLISERLL